MRTGIATTWLLLALACAAAADEKMQTIQGRVLDGDGKPVAGAAVDFFFWQAEESYDREAAEAEGQERTYSFGNGTLEPFRAARSGADGRFSIDVPFRIALMAVDAERKRGGVAAIPKNYDGSDVEIRLRPMVRVSGKVDGPSTGKSPEWTSVCVMVPYDPTRPLAMRRLVICGLPENRFSVLLPPGRYVLDVNSGQSDGELSKKIVLAADAGETDLGVLTLRPALPSINDRVKHSQTTGAMGDYTKHYGEKLPEWHITDAKGVKKDIRLADYRGKWVLIDFWALTCKVCLKSDLPRLAKFYEDHRDQRDQFEIVSICVDCDGRLRTLDEVDRELEPIVKHVWAGKPLPFPTLLDPSMTTLERYGVPGYFTLLVDPAGRLVEGDERVLAEKLAK